MKSSSQESGTVISGTVIPGAVIPMSFGHRASVFADACGKSRFLGPLGATILEARYQPS
jgi:hypothetical protein